MSTASLCVVLPCAGESRWLASALDSVDRWPRILVDDSFSGVSGPPTATRVRTGGLGFAGAVNAGLEEAKTQGFAWALVLNDDARVEEDCVQELLDARSRHPRALALGPVTEGPRGLESAGIRWNPLTARLKVSRHIPAHSLPVDALSGACLLLSTALRFDTAFPHGFEDVDLCCRIRAQGGEVVLVPTARCWHFGGATVDRQSARATRDALRGHLRLVGPSWKRAAVLGYAIAQVCREGAQRDRLAAIWEGWRLSTPARVPEEEAGRSAR